MSTGSLQQLPLDMDMCGAGAVSAAPWHHMSVMPATTAMMMAPPLQASASVYEFDELATRCLNFLD
jgi:hypothetical protein